MLLNGASVNPYTSSYKEKELFLLKSPQTHQEMSHTKWESAGDRKSTIRSSETTDTGTNQT